MSEFKSLYSDCRNEEELRARIQFINLLMAYNMDVY